MLRKAKISRSTQGRKHSTRFHNGFRAGPIPSLFTAGATASGSGSPAWSWPRKAWLRSGSRRTRSRPGSATLVHDGFALYETGAIARYIDRAFDLIWAWRTMSRSWRRASRPPPGYAARWKLWPQRIQGSQVPRSLCPTFPPARWSRTSHGPRAGGPAGPPAATVDMVAALRDAAERHGHGPRPASPQPASHSGVTACALWIVAIGSIS